MARKIAVADSETDPFKFGRIPAPFIWGVFDGMEFYSFRETRAFIEFLRDKEWIVYAHNGGKFDWHFVLPFIDVGQDIMVINGRLAKFKIGMCEFRDSWNILPFKLEAYKKTKIDYAKFEREQREKHMPEITAYLKDDCVDLYDLVSAFRNEYGSGLTLAGSAMTYWANSLDINKPETSSLLYDRIAPYYYGGRVQCFRSGIIEKGFQVFDINSAYPFAMLHHHPSGARNSVSNSLPETRDEISRCFISITTAAVGAFPYRTKAGLEFPADGIPRTFKVTGWEYLAALDTGALDARATIEKVIRFSDKIEFKNYVNHFYELKKKAKKTGDKISYLFAKLFLNSLYGKFAANPRKYKRHCTRHPEDINNARKFERLELSAMRHDIAFMQAPISPDQMRFYNVATGASITGFVRAMLWRAICAAETPLYCDTDSIAFMGKCDLPIGDELGQWESEGVFNFGAIGGKKLYAFRNAETGKFKTATKGVKLSPEEIIEIAKGKTITTRPEVPTFSIKEGISFVPRTINKTA